MEAFRAQARTHTRKRMHTRALKRTSRLTVQSLLPNHQHSADYDRIIFTETAQQHCDTCSHLLTGNKQQTPPFLSPCQPPARPTAPHGTSPAPHSPSNKTGLDATEEESEEYCR